MATATFTVTLSGSSFDDVQFWTGAGPYRAALVIDWNDGKSSESLLWGYRWEGSATGLDMLEAIVNADSALFAHFGAYAWGTAVLGIGYDVNRNGGFAVSPLLAFDGGGVALDTSPDDARAGVDPADHWVEGWNSGFWAYYLGESSAGPWQSATTGPAGRTLADGEWNGYSFAPGFVDSAPSEPIPAVVPEPATWSLLLLGGGCLLWRGGSRRPGR
jgi:hypothetical protein